LGLSARATGEGGSGLHVHVPETFVCADRPTATNTPKRASEMNRVFMVPSLIGAESILKMTPIRVPLAGNRSSWTRNFVDSENREVLSSRYHRQVNVVAHQAKGQQPQALTAANILLLSEAEKAKP
jgi:hypothetical protein